MSKRLNFRPGVNKDSSRFYIDEIPDDLWAEFTLKCKKLFPKKGESAWAEYIANSISSVIDGEKSILLITDIPPEALGAMGHANESADTHNLQVISSLLESAKNGRYHIINFDEKENEDWHDLVMLKIPDKFWKILEEMSKTAEVLTGEKHTAATILAEVVKTIAENGLKIDAEKTKK